MPRTKEQNEAIRLKKRRLIMDVALGLFAEQGYAATSIDKIANNAGISKGLLYNYFKSKEDLLQTMISGLLVEFENAIDPDHDGTVTDDEAIGFIDKIFGILMHRKKEMQLYCQLMVQPKVLDFLTRLECTLHTVEKQQRFLRYFIEKLPCADEKVAYLTIISFLKGLFLVCVFAPDRFPNDFLEQYKAYIKEKLKEAIQNKPLS
jgi:AcrR family transcriptional regulator